MQKITARIHEACQNISFLRLEIWIVEIYTFLSFFSARDQFFRLGSLSV